MPCFHLLDVGRILCRQLSVEVGRLPRYGQEKEAEEVEEGDAREYSDIGRAAADVLYPDGAALVLDEGARKVSVRRVGRPEVGG